MNEQEFKKVEAEINEIRTILASLGEEIDGLRDALKDLWVGTTWGAGKGAVFEQHRNIMVRAGIQDIGD